MSSTYFAAAPTGTSSPAVDRPVGPGALEDALDGFLDGFLGGY